MLRITENSSVKIEPVKINIKIGHSSKHTHTEVVAFNGLRHAGNYEQCIKRVKYRLIKIIRRAVNSWEMPNQSGNQRMQGAFCSSCIFFCN